MIEPVHCGSNGILKVLFFGTPCIWISLGITYNMLPTSLNDKYFSFFKMSSISLLQICFVRWAEKRRFCSIAGLLLFCFNCILMFHDWAGAQINQKNFSSTTLYKPLSLPFIQRRSFFSTTRHTQDYFHCPQPLFPTTNTFSLCFRCKYFKFGWRNHRKQKILIANFYAFVMPHAVVTAGEALED